MRKYENPTAELVMFNVDDIITVSTLDFTDNSVMTTLDLHAATTWDSSWDNAVTGTDI
ncbi:MAG: hypothetical protein J6C17_01375 [Clostridia bacterium]|nr:hypothetical protein [Clostridia bacterium]